MGHIEISTFSAKRWPPVPPTTGIVVCIKLLIAQLNMNYSFVEPAEKGENGNVLKYDVYLITLLKDDDYFCHLRCHSDTFQI